MRSYPDRVGQGSGFPQLSSEGGELELWRWKLVLSSATKAIAAPFYGSDLEFGSCLRASSVWNASRKTGTAFSNSLKECRTCQD